MQNPAMLMLNSIQIAELLSKLPGHSRVTFGRAQAVEILGEPIHVSPLPEQNGHNLPGPWLDRSNLYYMPGWLGEAA